MAYKPYEPTKLFYSIGEVATLFDLNITTLRFWETAFPMLNPRKTAKGQRKYSKDDLELLRMIYHLVKEKGMTLQGAKKQLEENYSKVDTTAKVLDKLYIVREKLGAIKRELDAMG